VVLNTGNYIKLDICFKLGSRWRNQPWRGQDEDGLWNKRNWLAYVPGWFHIAPSWISLPTKCSVRMKAEEGGGQDDSDEGGVWQKSSHRIRTLQLNLIQQSQPRLIRSPGLFNSPSVAKTRVTASMV
jgi:hypothetical protein